MSDKKLVNCVHCLGSFPKEGCNELEAGIWYCKSCLKLIAENIRYVGEGG